MRTTKYWYWGIAAAGIAVLLAACAALQSGDSGVSIGNSDLGGVVTGAQGPEAGVWVIAETTDLPTKFAKIVVTDDRGRYLIPALPKATYSVWVRGYGLVDSPKVRIAPGATLNLKAVAAPSPAAAAQYYPAIYWYSMLKIPAKDFGGSTNIPKEVTQEIWRRRMNNTDRVGCHTLGRNRRARSPPRSVNSSRARKPGRAASPPAHRLVHDRTARSSSAACRSSTTAEWTTTASRRRVAQAKPRARRASSNVVVRRGVGHGRPSSTT
jgi:hypothetical protein